MTINLTTIATKVRRLIGLPSSYQIADQQIYDYINSFYLYDFPAQYRALKLKDIYTFNTIRGLDTYAFDSEHYTTIEQPVRCAKREITLFNDPWSFYGANFNWQYQTNFATGTGGAGPYTGTTSATPIIRSTSNNPNLTVNPNYPASRVQNILITANVALGNTMNVTDDGNGNLIGDCLAGGTINYNTGAIAGLTFTSPIPAGNNIQIQYNPTTLSQPLSILFFQNQFTLRPVPDQGYTIELVAYRQPSQALMHVAPIGTGTPEQLEWWECIAIGAAKKYYEDLVDFDNIGIMEKLLKEKYALAETRTYAQLGKQRVNTIFADQLTSSRGGGGWGFGGGTP